MTPLTDFSNISEQVARLQKQVVEIQNIGCSLPGIEALNEQVRQLSQFDSDSGSCDLADTRKRLIRIVPLLEGMTSPASVLLVSIDSDALLIAFELFLLSPDCGTQFLGSFYLQRRLFTEPGRVFAETVHPIGSSYQDVDETFETKVGEKLCNLPVTVADFISNRIHGSFAREIETALLI